LSENALAHNATLAAQIIDLQTRVAYQDDTLAQLNDVITRQQQDIDRLNQALVRLAEKMQAMPGDGGDLDSNAGSDERPPHY
jgi:SlyX protein